MVPIKSQHYFLDLNNLIQKVIEKKYEKEEQQRDM